MLLHFSLMMKTIVALLVLTFLALTSAKKLSILDVLRTVKHAGDGDFEIVLRRKRNVDQLPGVKPYYFDHDSHRHKRSEEVKEDSNDSDEDSDGDSDSK